MSRQWCDEEGSLQRTSPHNQVIPDAAERRSGIFATKRVPSCPLNTENARSRQPGRLVYECAGETPDQVRGDLDREGLLSQLLPRQLPSLGELFGRLLLYLTLQRHPDPRRPSGRRISTPTRHVWNRLRV